MYELAMTNAAGKIIFRVCGMTADMVRCELRNRSAAVKFVRVLDEMTGATVTGLFV